MPTRRQQNPPPPPAGGLLYPSRAVGWTQRARAVLPESHWRALYEAKATLIIRRPTHTYLVVAGLFTAFFILRLPFRSRFLVNWDAVQLALGTHAFDLHRHQPHPPGYIGYVALGRLLNAVTADPNGSLTLISALGGGLAPAALFVLARRFLPAPYPLVAALLFGTSPLLWYYSEVALTYAAEAALVVPLVWACHHARSERSARHLLFASVLLALLGSVRQSALALLLPLWLYTAARFGWSRRLWAVSLPGVDHAPVGGAPPLAGRRSRVVSPRRARPHSGRRWPHLRVGRQPPGPGA